MFQFAIYIYIAGRFKVDIRINKYKQFIYNVAVKHDFKTILLEKWHVVITNRVKSFKGKLQNRRYYYTFFVKGSGKADDLKLKSRNIFTSTSA